MCFPELWKDGVGIIAKEDRCQKSNHPCSDASSILVPNEDDKGSDEKGNSSDKSPDEISPSPVDETQLVVQFTCVDDEYDNTVNQHADSQRGVAKRN